MILGRQTNDNSVSITITNCIMRKENLRDLHRDLLFVNSFSLILLVSNIVVILCYISIIDTISELCDEEQFQWFIYKKKLEDWYF